MPPEIHVIAEIERYRVAYDWAGDDEIKIKCPFHEDETASCNVSVSKRIFCCHAGSCGKTGDIVTLLAKIVGHSRAVVLEELGTRYDLGDVKIVDPEVVLRWHQSIWRAKPLLKELYDRGVIDDDIKYYSLGEESGRVTIPIPNARKDYVNVRKYLPGAPGPEKMRNMRGRGSARWFPEEQLKYDSLLLTGGEIKSIVAARHLNPHGMGAAWVTHGEKAIPPAMAEKLRGKSVVIGLDVDAAGKIATQNLGRMLKPIVAELRVVVWPLDIDKFPKGDVNDFVAHGGDIWYEVDHAEEWQDACQTRLEDTEPEIIALGQAASAQYAGKRIRVTAITTSMDTAPYVVPKDLVVKCDKSLQECAVCPVWPSQDGKFTVPIESSSILEVIHAPKRMVHDALVGACGIPRTCRICSFDVETYYNAEDVRLSPRLEITDRAADQKIQPAVCIGAGLDLNEPYEMVGRMWPHPQTQQSTLLISRYEQTRDALSTYQANNLDDLRVFRPENWTPESIDARLSAIYADLEMNVTRIFQRRDLHLAIDLAYHSPLFIRVHGDDVKGWVEVLVAGDSAQGKSECALRMMNHYQLGERLECKNATTAGLLGGLKQSGTRWFGEWGFIVRHDKRLVILEEIKGMHVDVIGKLTDMRSSGLAEINKIEKMRAHARTRAVWISNPRSEGRRVAAYGFGVDVVRELIGNLEDVRRFDLSLILADHEVNADDINKAHAARNGSHTKLPTELCRSLILWAWTRSPEQCVISKETVKLALEEATRFSELFTDQVPLLDRGSARFKILRLAASLAARTFSTSEDMLSLEVRECHVRYVAQLLERLYSKPAMGLLEYTRAHRFLDHLIDPEIIRKTIAALPFPYDFIDAVLRAEHIEPQDMMDWCGWERTETAQLISLLVRKHALRRDGKGYKKTAPFVDMLREILAARSIPERPDHIPETEF